MSAKKVHEIATLVSSMGGTMACPGNHPEGKVCNMCVVERALPEEKNRDCANCKSGGHVPGMGRKRSWSFGCTRGLELGVVKQTPINHVCDDWEYCGEAVIRV